MDTSFKWFTPTAGQTVLDPVTREPVPAKGKRVHPHDEYWVRRETDGDGTLSDTAPFDADE